MKTVGQMFSSFFDREFIEKARGYSRFFDSWTDITEKNGIASAASYSRIKDLDKGIVIIELDHPGWKQILQTKQSKLLYDFQYRFPDMDITGISLMLANNRGNEFNTLQETPPAETAIPDKPNTGHEDQYTPPEGIDVIKDEKLKDTLIRLGQLIQEKERKI